MEGPVIKTFIFPRNKEVKEIFEYIGIKALRETTSQSALVFEALQEYMKKHGDNAQRLLERFKGPPSHQHKWVSEEGGGAHWYSCECGEVRT